jgi:hypothetical protein
LANPSVEGDVEAGFFLFCPWRERILTAFHWAFLRGCPAAEPGQPVSQPGANFFCLAEMV